MNTLSISTAMGAPSKPATRTRDTAWLWMAIVLWIAAIGAGWWTVANYEFGWRDSQSVFATPRWPAGTEITPAAGRPTVLFFMHPKCPCTRATLNQLARLWVLGQKEGELAPHLTVVVTVPFGAADDWYDTPTVAQATKLAQGNLFIDRNGMEARRFGVATSGAVMWFDADGRRLYSGGVTPSRGHEGDSAGGDAVIGLLRGSHNPAIGLPAFGCRLCLPPTNDATEKRSTVNPSTPPTQTSDGGSP